MSSFGRQIHLSVLINATGNHIGGWRRPDADIGAHDFGVLHRIVEVAERGKFDMIFLADLPASAVNAAARDVVHLEVMSVLAALAVTTKNIGLAATVSTTYSEPFNVARMFGTIDHMSGGRAGWNVVTSSDPIIAHNFGLDAHPSKDIRYDRAAEFVEVVKGLWDSWEDGALRQDKASGIYIDTAKRHELNHKGKFFSVKGPLNVARPPQGYPVIVQAGSSPVGIAFAAKAAEVIFVVQDTIEGAKAFADKVRTEAEKAGRDPSSLIFLPGLSPIVADSEEEAKQILADLGNNVDPAAALQRLSVRMGMPLSGLPLDGPVPEVVEDSNTRGYARILSAAAKRHGFNLGQLRDYAALASGHAVMMGPAAKIADEIETWFEAGAADGFNLMPAWFPGSFTRFVDEVVPILQKRKLFRQEYTGRTLREHLGLARPPHPNAKP